ncbi:MAG TPA: universal stress protein [Gemmataceae bacterium]|nr:universal stress protein [Gemmataceae bacterium]
MLAIRGILHPTDFSEISANAFRLACSLAHDYRAPLYVLHVSTPVEAFENENLFDQHSSQYLAQAWEKLGQLTHPGINVHRFIEEGDAVEQILRFASSLHCDYIVMGSHGRTGLNRLLLGSVAEQVVRRAACQVIIVKRPVIDTTLASSIQESIPSKRQ